MTPLTKLEISPNRNFWRGDGPRVIVTAKMPTDRTAASVEQLSQLVAAAREAGSRIAQTPMTLRQWLAVVRAFREQGMIPGHPGRRQSSRQVARAYQDWKKGVRGTALFLKYIPRWGRLSYYARKVKAQRLLAAIRKRRHREKKGVTSTCSVP